MGALPDLQNIGHDLFRQRGRIAPFILRKFPTVEDRHVDKGPCPHLLGKLPVAKVKLTPFPPETEKIGVVQGRTAGKSLKKQVKKIVLLDEEFIADELGMNVMDPHENSFR